MAISRNRRVAVIGAGASGVFTAAHLLAYGLEVHVFERKAGPGGVWLYDDRAAISPPFPCIKPSEADELVPGGQNEEEIALRRAPPGPCYQNLRTNVPTQLMATTLLDIPLSTPEYVPHTSVLDYIQRIASKYRTNDVTTYSARVEEVQKADAKWVVKWTMPPKRSVDGNWEEMQHSVGHMAGKKNFDAVVVATGHYHAPYVPDITGLSRLKERYPSRVMHSKQYRRPERFTDKGDSKNVLVIGGGVSSVDIAKDMTSARHIYQSTRGSSFDLDARMLPTNASRVQEVVSFELDADADDRQALRDDEPLPVSAKLSGNETPLRGMDAILICTGYHTSLPFLRHYHADTTPAASASPTVLVTDGTQVHNLHHDIFYIPDPTLAFVGLPHHTFTQSVFDFQALAVAHALAGVASLPSEEEMRVAYGKKLEAVGAGKAFHSLQNKEEAYVAELVGWMNDGRRERGLDAVGGFSERWCAAKEALRVRFKKQCETGNFL